jgi:hypothetical protein
MEGGSRGTGGASPNHGDTSTSHGGGGVVGIDDSGSISFPGSGDDVPISLPSVASGSAASPSLP